MKLLPEKLRFDMSIMVQSYKLVLKFGRDDILKRFLQSGLSGLYFAVLKEGDVAAGDPIRLLHSDEHQVTVADITRLYRQDKYNLDLLRRVVMAEALPQAWRDYFRERLTPSNSVRKNKQSKRKHSTERASTAVPEQL